MIISHLIRSSKRNGIEHLPLPMQENSNKKIIDKIINPGINIFEIQNTKKASDQFLLLLKVSGPDLIRWTSDQ